MLSLMWLLLSQLTVIGRQISNVFAILRPELDSGPCAWCVRPFHMHRRIIMSHNSVTEIENMLTCSKIRTKIAFHRDMTSIIQSCLCIPPLTQEPSPCLRPKPISIWWLASEVSCRGKSLQVDQASLSAKVTNRTLHRAQDEVYSCSTAASRNPASHDYVLVRKSRAVFAIFWGQCQDILSALQMLFVQVWLYHHLVTVERQPEPWIRIWRTWCVFHGTCRPHPPVPVVSIGQASSASAETSPCAAAQYWWLRPSPSRVLDFRSAGPALSLHHPRRPHPPHGRNMQYRPDCLR